MNPNENRIRDLAYQIWESEGRPHGHSQRHWDTACRLAAETEAVESSHQVQAQIPRTRKASITSQGAAVSTDPQAGDAQDQAKADKPARKSRAKTPQMG
ncbi:MAG TPA: DUF2934 domain-containing protein [Cellvibrio sp.]|nr:DUF2934 domain-containing protein [Cellvibrio sp.]